jgi:peptidoglycan/xylan/chitin deacetylase (PgdA/CDA1 family)
MIKYFRTPNFFKWIFHRRVWGFSVSDTVYLTFDDGPTEALTPWIIEELKANDVKATFFCVGSNAVKYPQLIEELKQNGHAIGNHTMRHEKGTKSNKKKYMDSIEEANSVVQSTLFRPPYGRLPMTFARDIRKKYKVIMWTWLSYDYDKSIPVEVILKKAQRIKGGDILVVHDNIKTQDRLKELLPELIKLVKAKGLKFEILE